MTDGTWLTDGAFRNCDRERERRAILLHWQLVPRNNKKQHHSPTRRARRVN